MSLFSFFQRGFFSKSTPAKNTSDSDSALLSLSAPAQHVAVIMDGNGRWAKKKGMTRIRGHRQGKEAVKTLLKCCLKYQIPYVSIFAFSSENWNRPKSEVDALMKLLQQALDTQKAKLNENGIRFQIIGDLTRLSEPIQNMAKTLMQATKKNDKLHFTVAINYGGRWDVQQACQKIAQQVSEKAITPKEVDEALIARHLTTAHLPDPDLLIRTSGEQRISNFYLWQLAYTELYFTNVLWPDFDEKAFRNALLTYTQRDRRYGTIK